MKTHEARKIAAGHARRLGIPARLDGITILLTDYDDEQTLRFLKTEEPDITLDAQRKLNAAFAGDMRRRGARVKFVPVAIADYFAWLGKFNLKDSAGKRAQYISWLTCPAPKFQPTE